MTADVLIVTGFSGAGKSSALNVLEDMGYEVFDNIPTKQIRDILNESETTQSTDKNLAFGLDTRTRGFSSDALLRLKKDMQNIRILCLFCDEDILVRRYSETRRRHPLAEDDTYQSGIDKERTLLADIPHFSDISIDTSTLSVSDLKAQIKTEIGTDNQKEMGVQFLSFGFKNGVPLNADMVLDVRFLRNPHYDPSLKPKTGQDEYVANYIREDTRYDAFIEKSKGLIEFLLPAYRDEGKAHFTCAIGCTGGKHRSVLVAETLAQNLKGSVSHRDLGME